MAVWWRRGDVITLLLKLATLPLEVTPVPSSYTGRGGRTPNLTHPHNFYFFCFPFCKNNKPWWLARYVCCSSSSSKMSRPKALLHSPTSIIHYTFPITQKNIKEEDNDNNSHSEDLLSIVTVEHSL